MGAGGMAGTRTGWSDSDHRKARRREGRETRNVFCCLPAFPPSCDLVLTSPVRREHHPFWVQQVLNRASLLWAEHFLLPQFDAVGKEPRFQGARYILLLG